MSQPRTTDDGTGTWTGGDSGATWDLCLYVTGRSAKCMRAIENLRQAIELGYADFAHIAQDSDLVLIRDDPRYKEIMRK